MTTDEKLDLLLNEVLSLKSEVETIKATILSKADFAKAEAKLYDEIVRAEMQSEKIDQRVDVLTEKVDMLCLQADNTAIILSMTNKQAKDLEDVKIRLDRM